MADFRRREDAPKIMNDHGDRVRQVFLSIIFVTMLVFGGMMFLASHPYWSPSKPEHKDWSEFQAPRESYTLDELCEKINSFQTEEEFVKWMSTQRASDAPRVFACLRRNENG